jgi:hypothetical protein
MQEYGFDNTPGMFSQQTASQVAQAKLMEEFKKIGIK